MPSPLPSAPPLPSSAGSSYCDSLTSRRGIHFNEFASQERIIPLASPPRSLSLLILLIFFSLPPLPPPPRPVPALLPVAFAVPRGLY